MRDVTQRRIAFVRALGRFRWLLPALALPACVVVAAVAIQAAAFGKAPEDARLAASALRELVRFHVMRGTELIDGRSVSATCVQGWFTSPRHPRLVRGALVLLGNGERLYSLSSGIRRLLPDGDSRPAPLADRIRFVLAGCPHYLDDRFATDLILGRRADAVDLPADGTEALAITFGTTRARLTYDVQPANDRPLALSFTYAGLHGSSDLVPGGGALAVEQVRRAFDLRTVPRHGRA
jgi:hypothetical protein